MKMESISGLKRRNERATAQHEKTLEALRQLQGKNKRMREESEQVKNDCEQLIQSSLSEIKLSILQEAEEHVDKSLRRVVGAVANQCSKFEVILVICSLS